MPRVPVVDGPRVAETPLQGGQQRSSVTPGMLQSQQMGETGRALTEIGAAIQERTDADLVMRAETELKNQYLTWEADAKQRRGQQAWGVAKDASKWFDDNAGKIAEGLTNERQRMLYTQTVQKLRTHSLGTFSEFEAGQRRESLDSSAQASIVGSINMAAANPQNAEVLAATKADILKRNQARAQLNGWAPELATAKEAEYLTNFHKQVLQSMVDRDPTAAQGYFELNKGEIAGADHAEIEKVLKVGGLARKAQAFADEVITGGMDEAAALAEARKRFEGDDEKHAVAEVKTRFAERTAARERMQRDAADEAFGVYARTGRISAVPPSVLAKMDGKTLLALRQQAQHDVEGKAAKTDMTVYYALSRLADSDPEAFTRRDLRGDFGALSRADQKHFIDLQAKIRTPEEQIKEAAINRQLMVTFRTMGWGDGENDLKKKGGFEKAVRDEMRALETAHKRPLTGDERQQVIDRMLIQGEVLTGSWWRNDPNMRYYEASPEQRAKFAPTVPPEERAKIVEALKRAGREPTDEEVRRLYMQRHGAQ